MKSAAVTRFIIGIPFLLSVILFIVVSSGVLSFKTSIEKQMRSEQEQILSNRKRQTAETTGAISEFSTSRGGAPKYPVALYHFGYEYVIDGKPFYSPARSNTAHSPFDRYSKGTKGKVCYEPSNPENSSFSFAEENRMCGQ